MNLSRKLESSFTPEIREALSHVSKIADKKKVRAALVGGVVRDMLLEVPTEDADIMFEHPAKPLVEELAKKLNAKMVSHERFYTFTLIRPDALKIDVVTAREETYPKQGQLPNVTPSTFENDLKRRDFTMNAIACSLNKKDYGLTIDPFEGEKDLWAKSVRALHKKSFEDDPTRIYRAARFAARLGFKVESDTMEWISKAIEEKRAAALTPVRRRHEFEIILKEDNPVAALQLLKEWGALGQLHPDFERINLASLAFEPGMDFLSRLGQWFGAWKKDDALKTMTELGFEKTVKKQVFL